MHRILYISAFLPDENAGHAGGRVAFENITSLKKQGVVDLIACTSEVLLFDGGFDIAIVRQKKLALLAYLIRNILDISLWSMLVSPIIHTRLNQKAENIIVELLNKYNYDEVFVDFTQCLLLTDRAIKRSGKTVKITACLHDIFAQRMIRSRQASDILMTGLVCKQEQLLIDKLDNIIVLSVKDMDLVKSLYSAKSVMVKSFHPPAWCVNVIRRQSDIDKNNIVFFGNFDRTENYSAVLWFVTNALKEIKKSIPDVTLTLLGTGSDRLAKEINISNVSGTGFIKDPSGYFSKCACAVAPLFEGAGVKFKVLEVLACGVPVIGTNVACEGIPSHPMLFNSNHTSFASDTVHFLKSNEER